MSRARAKLDPHAPRQLSFFDLVQQHQARQSERPRPGSFNVRERLAEALTEALKGCPFTRYEAAARMSELLGVEVTKTQLDSWTAESKEYHRFPAEYLAAFCKVTGSLEPLRIMAELLQCYVIESEEALLAELGKIDQARKELARRERAIRQYLEEMRRRST